MRSVARIGLASFAVVFIGGFALTLANAPIGWGYALVILVTAAATHRIGMLLRPGPTLFSLRPHKRP